MYFLVIFFSKISTKLWFCYYFLGISCPFSYLLHGSTQSIKIKRSKVYRRKMLSYNEKVSVQKDKVLLYYWVSARSVKKVTVYRTNISILKRTEKKCFGTYSTYFDKTVVLIQIALILSNRFWIKYLILLISDTCSNF